ncbi:MAG: hypothetical protein QXH91_04125 [Candidatus Bathyarchaeia archaeon]
MLKIPISEMKVKSIIVALEPPRMVKVIIPIPKRVSNFKKLAWYMWKRYHIDVGEDDKLFYNYDWRSIIGYIEWFESGKASLVILPKVFAVAFKEEWNKLITDATVIYT